MAILNYTTKVPVERTVAEIHRILLKAGARQILNEYDAKGACGLKFLIRNSSDHEVLYSLPVDVAGVSLALRNDREYRDDDHARRVAWRIVKDWIEAQMAIISANMAKLDQVFLPYAQTSNGKTVYERIKTDQSQLLLGGK